MNTLFKNCRIKIKQKWNIQLLPPSYLNVALVCPIIFQYFPIENITIRIFTNYIYRFIIPRFEEKTKRCSSSQFFNKANSTIGYRR